MVECKLTIDNKLFKVSSKSGGSSMLDFYISEVYGTKNSQAYKFIFSCNKLEYYKEVYKPCEIVAHMEITQGNGVTTLPTVEALEDLFLQKPVTMNVVSKQDTEEAGKSTDDVLDQPTAQKYYVHEIIPEYKSSSSLEVEIHIFSNDKKLTLDKYCKAYTGRKLVKNILKEYLNYGYEDWKTGVISYTSIVGSTLKNAGVDIASDAKLQFLSYTKDNTTEELIQPYLVQYNESFYDFMARTANRCGEFMFFEKGKLYVGLPKSLDQKTIDSFTSLKYHRYNKTNNPEPSVISVQNLSYNGVEKDAKIVADDNGEVYDFQLSHNEYFTEYIKGSYTDIRKQMGIRVEREAVTILGAAFSNSTIAKVVSAYALQKAKMAALAASRAKTKNDEMNSKFYNTLESDQKSSRDKNKDKDKDENEDEDDLEYYATLFSTAGKEGKENLTSLFYALTREKEQSTVEKAVTITTGDAGTDIMLADQIKVNGKDYIVVKIEANINSDVKYIITAVPKNDDGNWYPPLLDGDGIRHSGPQVAIVADVHDPKSKGRVRIRYPWQKQGDDMSPWIRMAVPFSSEGGGIYFEPKIDTELLVDYAGGNVERPYIVGQLYARKGEVPWTFNPDTRVIASAHGQKIIMDDEDPLDTFTGIKGVLELIPDVISPGENILEGKAGGIKMTDAYGIYTISMSTKDRNITINSPLGDVNLNAFTGITISAPNGDISITGKNVSIIANNRLELYSGNNIYDGSLDKQFLDNSKKELEETPANILEFLWDNMVHPLLGPINMKLIRTVVEAFAPPKAGNFNIHSNRYLTLSAGKSKTELPKEAFNTKKQLNEDTKLTEGARLAVPYDYTEKTFENLSYVVDVWLGVLHNMYKNIQKTISSLKVYIKAHSYDSHNNEWAENENGLNDIIKTILDKGRVGDTNIDQNIRDIFHSDHQDFFTEIIKKEKKLAEEMCNYVNTIKKPCEKNNAMDLLFDNIKIHDNTSKSPFSYIDNDDKLIPQFYKNTLESGNDMSSVINVDENEIKKIKRRIVVKCMKDLQTLEFNDSLVNDANIDNTITDDKKWTELADSLKKKKEQVKEKGFWQKAGENIVNRTKNKVDWEWLTSMGTWGNMDKGEILLSDKDNRTIYFQDGLKYRENSDNGKRQIERIKKVIKEY